MPNIVRRDMLKVTAAIAAGSAIKSVMPTWASARNRSTIAHYPTILGGGGHNTGAQIYSSGSYFGNVGLGRDIMETNPVANQAITTQYIRLPGTISELSWGLVYNSGSYEFSSLIFGLNVENSPTSLGVSFSGGTSGWMTDVSHSITVSSGQRLSFQVTVDPNISSPPGVFKGAFCCASAQFLSSDDSVQSAQLIDVVGSTLIEPTSTQSYGHFLGVLGNFGSGDASADETDEQFRCLTPGRWRNMAFNTKHNVFYRNTIVTNRIQGSLSAHDGCMALNIPANTSGYLEDMTDYDDVSVGNLLDYGFVQGNTIGDGDGTHLTMDWVGAHFVASTPDYCMIGGAPVVEGETATMSAGVTVYSSLFGGGNTSTVPERSTGRFPYPATLSNFSNYVLEWSSQTPAGGATFELVGVGGTTTLFTTTVSDLQTGWFTAAGSVEVDVLSDCANKICVHGTQNVDPTLKWGGASLLVQAN